RVAVDPRMARAREARAADEIEDLRRILARAAQRLRPELEDEPVELARRERPRHPAHRLALGALDVHLDEVDRRLPVASDVVEARARNLDGRAVLAHRDRAMVAAVAHREVEARPPARRADRGVDRDDVAP